MVGVVPGGSGAASASHASAAGLPPGVRYSRGLLPGTAGARYVADRTSAVQALLARRADAVLHHDRAGFLSGVDPDQPALRAEQAELYASLAKLPVGSFRYTLDARGYPVDRIDWRRYRGDVYVAGLQLAYTLAGFDPAPVTRPLIYTFVQRAGGWYLGGDSDGARYVAVETHSDPWDVGPIAVARGARSLVIGSPADARDLPAVARAADAAVGNVVRVWPSGWSRRVVVDVSRAPALLRNVVAASSQTTAIEHVAAVVAPLYDADQRYVSARVVVNPRYFNALDPGNRQLLTHEVTHVATFPVTGRGTPTWLVEGFAEYVAKLRFGTGYQVSRGFYDKVRRGWLPAELPTDADFQHSTDPAGYYDEGYLAAKYIASRFGQPRLLALYRTLGGRPYTGPLTGTDDVTAALFRTTRAQVTAGWRDYVRVELAR